MFFCIISTESFKGCLSVIGAEGTGTPLCMLFMAGYVSTIMVFRRLVETPKCTIRIS